MFSSFISWALSRLFLYYSSFLNTLFFLPFFLLCSILVMPLFSWSHLLFDFFFNFDLCFLSTCFSDLSPYVFLFRSWVFFRDSRIVGLWDTLDMWEEYRRHLGFILFTSWWDTGLKSLWDICIYIYIYGAFNDVSIKIWRWCYWSAPIVEKYNDFFKRFVPMRYNLRKIKNYRLLHGEDFWGKFSIKI